MSERRSVYNSRREWRGNCLLAGRKFSEEENPLIVIPSKKLTPRDVMAVFRDHYEGTPYDATERYEKGSPHQTSERTICVMATDASTVAHLRNWLPSAIGGVLWLSAGTPCSSVYVPFYLGVLEFPQPYSFVTESYDGQNAFWVFNSLENLVDRYYGQKIQVNGTEVTAIDSVAGIWKDFENKEFGLQEAMEQTAVELHKKDPSLARIFLNAYSNAMGNQAYASALKLADLLRTRYYR
jgi:dipeptidase